MAQSDIVRLWRRRPRSRFLRASGWLLLALGAYAWARGELLGGVLLGRGLLSPRSAENLSRFLSELRPFPLRDQPFDLTVAAHWAWDLLSQRGLAAALTTLAISIVAIVLAGLGGAVFALPAARTLATAEPYLPAARAAGPPRRLAWRALALCTRAGLIFLRSIPEYLWAFLLVALLGPVTWAAVLALAIHNTGILGKLDAEMIENLDARPMRALRGAGASRAQLAGLAILPMVTPRLLLFFFYRWETCVREATVIGLLGIASLGAFIQDARARQQYDVMLLYLVLGALIVVAGDLLSGFARSAVRRGAVR